MRNSISMKHNKRRNVGIVYEMLARCVSESMLDDDRARATSAMKLLKKYFAKGQPLANELAIHQAIMSRRGVSLPLARRIIAEAIKDAAGIDRKLCEIKKSNLIKELNYGFGRDFFDRYRIPEYRALASVHMLIQSSGASRTLIERVERATLEESIVQFMCSTPSSGFVVPDERRNSFTLRIANEEFARTIGSELHPEQSALLEAYNLAAMGGDRKRFRELAEDARRRSVTSISRYMGSSECASDPVLLERVGRVLESLRGLKVSLNEGCLEDLMNAQDVSRLTENE
jgi:hypothetical protein